MNKSTWRDEEEQDDYEWREQAEIQELLLKSDPCMEQLSGYDFTGIESRIFSRIYDLSRNEGKESRRLQLKGPKG